MSGTALWRDNLSDTQAEIHRCDVGLLGAFKVDVVVFTAALRTVEECRAWRRYHETDHLLVYLLAFAVWIDVGIVDVENGAGDHLAHHATG